jgi:hypothetical protein
MNGWSLSALLPGLCFLALAAGLAAALRRWYDPLPPRFLAVFAVLVSVLFASSLFGGWILLPLGNLTSSPPFRELPQPPRGNWLQGDLIHQITPWELEVRRAVFDGRWPLWNAKGGPGMPLLGDPQTQAFQPLVAAAYLLPVCQAAAVTSALRVFIALAFSFLFFRRQRLGSAAALCGALAYGLGGFLLLWLGWPIGNAAALLPALLYAVVLCDEEGRRRDAVLLFLVTAAVFLGGHPETMLYALTCGGLFLGARAVSPERPAWRERLPLLVRAGAAMALAGLVAAPVLLPVSGHLPETHRAAVIGAHFAHSPVSEAVAELRRPEGPEKWKDDALRRVLPVAAPRAFGDLRLDYWGSANFIEDTGGFVGAAALLLALLTCWPVGKGRRFPQERFAIALLLVCLALIAQPPGFDSLFFRLPVFGATAVHRHHRILLLTNFAVAWLAACGIERWQRGEMRRAVVVPVALGLAGLITWAYLAHPSPNTGRVITGLADGGLAAQLLALGLAAGLLLVRPGSRPGVRAPWALAALTAAELFLLHGKVNSVVPPVFAYPDKPSIAFLQKSLGPARMMGLGDAFPPNIPLFYGLRDARIDNPSLPTAYARLMAPLSRDQMVPRFARPRHPLYDLLGVRYMAVRPRVHWNLPLVYQDREMWIYERPGALPLLFLPARARIQRDEPWLKWVQENTDFAARALVAPSAERWQHWRSAPGDGSTVTLTSYGPALLRARAVLTAPRLLASSVYQDGNWRLLDGGARVPTTLANGPFLASWLPAGEHDLILVYRPLRFVAGCLLAALALAAAAVLWVPRPVPWYPDSDGSDPRPG